MAKEKICPVCGTHNEEASTVCKKCGSLLEYQEKRKDYRPIITLIGLLIVIAAIAIGGYLFLEGQYSKAKDYYEYGNYSAAADIFTKIPFYKDSKNILESDDMSTEMAYRDALKLYKNKNYLKAYEWFVDNSYYEDSSDYMLLSAQKYLAGSWKNSKYIYEFYTDGVNIYNDKRMGYSDYKTRYKITEYETGRTYDNELVIQMELEYEGEIVGYICLANLQENEFECSSNGTFTRRK